MKFLKISDKVQSTSITNWRICLLDGSFFLSVSLEIVFVMHFRKWQSYVTAPKELLGLQLFHLDPSFFRNTSQTLSWGPLPIPTTVFSFLSGPVHINPPIHLLLLFHWLLSSVQSIPSVLMGIWKPDLTLCGNTGGSLCPPSNYTNLSISLTQYRQPLRSTEW